MDKPVVWILIALAAIGLVYFLFIRKKDAPEELPEKAEPRPKAVEGKKPAKEDKPEAAKPAKTEPRSLQDAKTIKEPAVHKTPGEQKSDQKAKKEPEDEKVSAVRPDDVPPPPRPGAAAAAAAAKVEPTPSRRTKDVAGLRRGLAKARASEGLFGRLKALFGGKKEIDPQIVEQMEEILLTSDVGVKTTQALVEEIREELNKGDLKDEGKVWDALRRKTQDILDIGTGGLPLAVKPTVVMVVGVNGVGKTTTIGKLATRLVQQNKKVVLAAGDTFRAAAVQQLGVWGKRAGCEVVTGAEGANAGAVIFDAIQKAKEIGADVVLADTAGRLHTKSNLMDELKKIAKTMNKALEGAPHETLLVVDATNGQNASQQTAMFKEALPLTGIVLTKLDGTAKGGVILGICAEHKVPVRYIGVGEKPEDLRDFQAEEFVEALLGAGTEASERAA